jgi:hypothetical protein
LAGHNTGDPVAGDCSCLEALPLHRKAIADDPRYYTLRNYILEFLYNRFALADEAE